MFKVRGFNWDKLHSDRGVTYFCDTGAKAQVLVDVCKNVLDFTDITVWQGEEIVLSFVRDVQTNQWCDCTP